MAESWQQLSLEETNLSGGHCDCCGTETVQVSGFVYDDGQACAGYWVSWTKGRPNHGVEFTLIVGQWGEDAGPDTRSVAILDFAVAENGEHGFVVSDHAAQRFSGSSELASSYLKRTDIVGAPLANSIYMIADAILMSDSRIDEIRGWTEAC